MNLMHRPRHTLSRFDRIARWIDVNRIVPRSLLYFYVWQMWRVAGWAMAMPEISQAQAFFCSTVYGAFPFLLNFYMQQGNVWPVGRPLPGSMFGPPVTPTGPWAAADAIAGPRPLGPLTRGN